MVEIPEPLPEPAFALPTAIARPLGGDDDDYDDEADKQKALQQRVLMDQKEFQTAPHIPTHEQLKHGITSEVLADTVLTTEEKAELTGGSGSKEQDKNESSATTSATATTSRTTRQSSAGGELHRQNSESIRKQAKFSAGERDTLTVYHAFTDDKLEPTGSSKNKELLEKIFDNHEKVKLSKLFTHFDQQQEEQYVNFRRSHFQKPTVKKIMQTIGGNAVNQNVIIAMSGIAKVYAGEIIEKALEIKQSDPNANQHRSIEPRHIRRALRQMHNTPNIYMPNRPKAKRKYTRLL